MRQACLFICLLLVVSVVGCRPAATPGDVPSAPPAPTEIAPVVGTAVPGDAGSLPVPPPVTAATPSATLAAPPTPAPTKLVPTGSSGIRLTATVGPTCPGPERPGQVCTQPYEGLFVVTNSSGAETARATTDQAGQVLIDLPPGEYTVTPKIEGRFPSGAPVTVTVTDGQYADVNIELDSGMR